ncbi:hypothetical protein F9C28_07095 [Shimwellia pseudoproteus]|uniref:hypothetical protein n=1 Tax=Shimwellia pseudoproteus TaxID=570012 RepID=UPI0018ECC25B|nr:hypothetical protein [Shimwellia pseudoproteus]MBJ3814694.1 hypothetical protein [Shimwellia pseudoproteus]
MHLIYNVFNTIKTKSHSRLRRITARLNRLPSGNYSHANGTINIRAAVITVSLKNNNIGTALAATGEDLRYFPIYFR